MQNTANNKAKNANVYNKVEPNRVPTTHRARKNEQITSFMIWLFSGYTK